MLHRCEHGVAGGGLVTVGEAADGDVFRNSVAHVLCRVDDADSRIIVYRKERIGNLLLLQQLRRDGFRIHTVVTLTEETLLWLQSSLQQRIPITIVSVLGNLQFHRCPVEGYTATTCGYQIVDSIVCTHIVVNNHATGIHTRTDTVIEHQGYTLVDEILEMVILLGVFCLRYDNATHLIFKERLADVDLFVVFLITLCHHHPIAAFVCLLFDSRKNTGKEIMCKLRNDDADNFQRLHTAFAQRTCNEVRIEVVLLRVLFYHITPFRTDAGTVTQGS